jgi:hypothetical protein
MQFDRITGELNVRGALHTRRCMAGWTPYYNLEGKYVGFKCKGWGVGYSLPDLTDVKSYEELNG